MTIQYIIVTMHRIKTGKFCYWSTKLAVQKGFLMKRSLSWDVNEEEATMWRLSQPFTSCLYCTAEIIPSLQQLKKKKISSAKLSPSDCSLLNENYPCSKLKIKFINIIDENL